MEINGKSIVDEFNQFMNDRAAMVAAGSCRTCRFLDRHEADESSTWDILHKVSYWCGVQGNFNPHVVNEANLDNATYPLYCDEGQWHKTDDAGEWQHQSTCFAYQRDTGEPLSEERRTDLAHEQMTIMRRLWDASELRLAFLKFQSGEAQEKIRKVMDEIRGPDPVEMEV